MKLSIIIPVYNEEKTILEILRRVEAVKFPIEKEIIIVNDGSTDKTIEILKKFETQYKIIHLSKNRGKGFAIKTGIQEVKGNIIAIQDADLEYNPEELPKLIQPILQSHKLRKNVDQDADDHGCLPESTSAEGGNIRVNPRYDLRESAFYGVEDVKVVYGSRFLTKHKPRYKISYFGNKFLSFLFWLLYGKKINDPWTCYKVFKKEIIQDMNFQSNGFEFEMELTVKILKAGYKILEIPISYQSRTYEEGKKIKIKDGLKAIWTVIKYRFR